MKSNAQGNYEIPPLPPGTYTITVTAPGFGVFFSRNVMLEAQREVRIDARLNIGSQTSEVIVTGGAPVIQAENQTVSSIITSKQLDDSATNLRSMEAPPGQRPSSVDHPVSRPDAHREPTHHLGHLAYHNNERPHEGLKNQVPASLYIPSSTRLPHKLPEFTYTKGLQLRRVNNSGDIC